MGNSLRCCLACVLPCGALDVIRIVHLNGQVEEITRPISAGEVLEANPNYILSKPCSQGVVRRILILSPESELKRGNIYFLIPASSVPTEKKQKHIAHQKKKTVGNVTSHDDDHDHNSKKNDRTIHRNSDGSSTKNVSSNNDRISNNGNNKKIISSNDGSNNVDDKKYIKKIKLQDISTANTMTKIPECNNHLLRKKSYRARRDRRRSIGGSRDWRPRLESISEDPSKLFSGDWSSHLMSTCPRMESMPMVE